MSLARRAYLCSILAVSLAVLGINVRHFFWLHSNAAGLKLPDGKTIGSDFPTFYLAGRAYRTDTGLIYNHARLHEEQRRLFGGTDGPGLLAYVYPPLVAAFFAPFSRLPYLEAAYLWHALSLSMALLAMYLTVRARGVRGLPAVTGLFVALSYVPLSVYCIAGAQTSTFGLLILAAMYAARKAGREVLAGAALSFSYYKPPPFLGLLLFQLVARRHLALKGFAAGAAALVLLSWLAVGTAGLENFLGAISSYGHGREILPGFVHRSEMGSGLMSYLLAVFPGNQLAAKTVFFVIAAVLFLVCTRVPHANEETRFSLEVCCSLFISVWFMHYEYALLAIPIYLLVVEVAARPASRHSIGLIAALFGLYFSYLLPKIELFGAALKPDVFFLFLLILGLIHFAKHPRVS